MRRIAASIAATVIVIALAPLAGAEHVEEYVRPGEPTVRDFPADFEIPVDAQAEGRLYSWADSRMGGWGGDYEGVGCPDGDPDRVPVVFVHGTSEDAPTAWRQSDNGSTTVNVRQRFIDSGWCPEDLWAPSYTGARGYLTYNDAQDEEVYAFIQEVLDFTGAEQVDVVAHSLGVTVTRWAIDQRLDAGGSPSWLRRFVAIGGPNHGSTACRGLGRNHFSHVCEETEPDDPTFTNEWLADLNSPYEAVPGVGTLVIYDSLGDNFYVGPDARSPRLDGACNHDLPGRFHLPIGRGLESVTIYRQFLLEGTLPTCHD